MAVESSAEASAPCPPEASECHLEITVLSLAAESLAVISIPSDSTVLDVKQEIAIRCGHLVETQELFYDQLMLDDRKTLQQNGFTESVAVTLVLKSLDVDLYIDLLRGKGSMERKDFEDIKLLCHLVGDILMKEPMVLDLHPPLVIAGNLLGSAKHLNHIFNSHGQPPESQYLFLGNHVGWENTSVDTLVLLLLYKLKYPSRIHLLRGKYESGLPNLSTNGFYDLCKRKFNILTWKAFVKVFSSFSSCALIQDRIFCVPLGVPEVNDIAQLRRLRKTDDFSQGPLCDLLWSNFHSGERWWSGNNAQARAFGPAFLEDFLTKNRLEMIVCSQGPAENGHESLHGDKFVSVFSTSDYLGEWHNPGAVLLLDEQLGYAFSEYYI